MALSPNHPADCAAVPGEDSKPQDKGFIPSTPRQRAIGVALRRSNATVPGLSAAVVHGCNFIARMIGDQTVQYQKTGIQKSITRLESRGNGLSWRAEPIGFAKRNILERIPAKDVSPKAYPATLPLAAATGHFLDDVGVDPEANVDVHAFKLKLLAIRDRIPRYTKDVRRVDNSPAESRAAMEALQVELNTFERGLPIELKLTPQRLVNMGHSREAGTYAGLHALWMMCHCDLHRFCVPGIRESVPQDALAQIPLSFIEYCLQACFDTAFRLSGFWSELYHLESCEYFGDEFLAVSIYQFTEALQLAAPLRSIHASVINRLGDAERLVSALGRGSVARFSPDANPVGGIDTARDHLASKHSVLLHLYSDTEADNNALTYQTTNSGPVRERRRFQTLAQV
ncbi:hypothetical protein BDW75DRAFT_242805 [Aspergillus navahoensis]